MLDLLLIAFPRSPHGPLRTPAQSNQKLPDMAFVIAHAELLLNQVGHAGAGPQRRFIAQPLGTLKQKFSELSPLRLAQARFAARPSGFAKCRSALSTILLHPAGHALADYTELASNLRLVLPSLPQPNGLKATVLEGLKIASYSGGVSHGRLDAANPCKVSLYYAGFNNLRHELVRLAELIDWKQLEKHFAVCYLE